MGESVNGDLTAKVAFEINSNTGGSGTATIWISEETNNPVKVTMTSDGTSVTFEGPMAQQVGQSLLALLSWPIAFMGTAAQLQIEIIGGTVEAGKEGVVFTATPTVYVMGNKEFPAYTISWHYASPPEDGDLVSGEITIAELLSSKWFIVKARGVREDCS